MAMQTKHKKKTCHLFDVESALIPRWTFKIWISPIEMGLIHIKNMQQNSPLHVSILDADSTGIPCRLFCANVSTYQFFSTEWTRIPR